MPEKFRLDNSDPNCPYRVIRSETERSPWYEGRKKYGYSFDNLDGFDRPDKTQKNWQKNAIPIVSRGTKFAEYGVIGKWLLPNDNYTPFPKGSIFIPVGKEASTLRASLMPRTYYVNRDTFVLIPKWRFIPLSSKEKIYHITQIREQMWRFPPGVSAISNFKNLTIQSLSIKDQIIFLATSMISLWTRRKMNFSRFNKLFLKMDLRKTEVSRIGVVKKGIRFSPRDLDYPSHDFTGHPYITCQLNNNKNNMGGGKAGTNTKRVVAYNYGSGNPGVKSVEIGGYVEPNGKAGTIAFGYDGNPGHATYMPEDYYCRDCTKMIELKEEYNHESVAMFVAWMINRESWRYQYKRKISGEREKLLSCLLPYKDGKIDVEGIKKLMKTLPKWAEVFPK